MTDTPSTTPPTAFRRRRDEALRVAVVGVGGMGRNHARVYSQMKGVDLVAIVDPDGARAREVAELYGGSPLTAVEQLDGVDAVSIAAPSVLHARIGADLLARGVHCLVEKPLATTREDGEALIAAADAGGAVLLVGHIERFNPAVRQLKTIVDSEDIVVLNARRMSAVSGRITDVDVVSDLMVHDLDIVRFLMGGDITDVTARGVDGPHGPDHVTALLSFTNGRMASLTASRVTQNQVRSLEVTTRERFYTVDYPNQELLIYRQGRIGGTAADDGSYVLDVGTERVFVRRLEPLVEELQHFVGAARGEHPPEVDGASALAALDLVWDIQTRLQTVGVGG
ncbi:MAG: Gfo/Idh/MocA family oxidoreductase [Actinomycetota bacterium]